MILLQKARKSPTELISFTAALSEHMQRTWDTFQWDTHDIEDDPFEDFMG